MTCNKADDILNIIRLFDENQFGNVIVNNNCYEITMALSHVRSNCVEWIRMTKSDHVLEWGADYGAITGLLSRKAGNVTCFEPSVEKCQVIQERYKDRENIRWILSDITEFTHKSENKKYDYIYLIGSLEDSAGYFGGNKPEELLLSFLKNYLTDNGKIVITCTNKFGLKYWSGCAEDRSRRLFEGLEGFSKFPEFNSFTKNGIEMLAKNCGYKIISTRYLYPDYKTTLSVFSDDYLPKAASLYMNSFSWEETRAALFSERKVMDNIIKENLFPLFSNSFLFILGNENSPVDEFYDNSKQIFVKYSNIRSAKFQIRTDIVQFPDGTRAVEKRQLSDEAYEHLAKIFGSYKKMSATLSNKNIIVNPCHKRGDCLIFDYYTEPSFSDYLNDLISRRKNDQFIEEVTKFFNTIKSEENTIFQITPEFTAVFGDVSFTKNDLMAASIGNIDLNFDNIFLIDGSYYIIDYEWNFYFPIPINYIINGCLDIFFNHLVDIDDNIYALKKELYEIMDISQEEVVQYTNMWHSFDKYMMGENSTGFRNLQLKHVYQLFQVKNNQK